MNIDLVLKRLELIKEDKGIGTISDTEASIILNKIERLKELCNKYEEEHKTVFEEWKKTINIINELDKFLKDKIDSWKIQNDDEIVKDTIYHERLAVRLIYYYLQELKGDGSNER